MARIKSVGSLPDYALDIQLENGSTIILELEPYLKEPRFAELLEDDRIRYPKTDGKSVYWRDGPRLSVEEALKMVGKNGGD